jgi:hypothetical protein
MTDYIYNYPKSFCDYTLPCNPINPNKGIPSNLSISNCNIPCSFNNNNSLLFKTDIQPNNTKTGYEYYNSKCIADKYSKDFQKINDDVYYSPDPRLIDVPRGIVTTLSTPPIDGNTRLRDIYKIDKNYGKGYNTYSDVTGGQILYYNDKTIEDPYFYPNFVDKAVVNSTIYQDPMGALKPHYDRYQIKGCSNVKCYTDGCLSSVNDTQGFRENIMASQMAKMNQQKWSSRWTNLDQTK